MADDENKKDVEKQEEPLGQTDDKNEEGSAETKENSWKSDHSYQANYSTLSIWASYSIACIFAFMAFGCIVSLV